MTRLVSVMLAPRLWLGPFRVLRGPPAVVGREASIRPTTEAAAAPAAYSGGRPGGHGTLLARLGVVASCLGPHVLDCAWMSAVPWQRQASRDESLGSVMVALAANTAIAL